jgi:hypothetical protein
MKRTSNSEKRYKKSTARAEGILIGIIVVLLVISIGQIIQGSFDGFGKFCLIITGLSIAIPIVVGLFCKYTYTQIGQTCGFYALVYALNQKDSTINKKELLKTMVVENIENRNSNIGEIFDIDIMFAIANHYFPDLGICIQEFQTIQDIQKILQKNFVVFPVCRGSTPHYFYLESVDKNKFVYRSDFFCVKLKKRKDKMLKAHEKLKEKHTYKWQEYCTGPTFQFTKIVNRIGDAEFSKYLDEIYNQRREVLKNETEEINLYHKVLVIPKY